MTDINPLNNTTTTIHNREWKRNCIFMIVIYNTGKVLSIKNSLFSVINWKLNNTSMYFKRIAHLLKDIIKVIAELT